MSTKNCFVYGTRPELIKMFPVIKHTRNKYVVCTGQHDSLLDRSLLTPDIDLDLLKTGQSLDSLVVSLLSMLTWVFEGVKPERIIVQGDTATAFAASLYAFHNHVELAHIEAGLRTWDKNSPWPEEVYRQFISSVADIHFCPTSESACNLGDKLKDLYVTGNTIVDSVTEMAPTPTLSNNALVTLHRRESHVKTYSRALYELIKRNPDYIFEIVIHPNPTGQELRERLLSLKGRTNVRFIDPLGYVDFLNKLAACYMVITDSGGLQEEAATLHKPVLILRNKTERPECLGGVGKLITEKDDLVYWAEQLLNNKAMYKDVTNQPNPFGDGHAGERIADILNK